MISFSGESDTDESERNHDECVKMLLQRCCEKGIKLKKLKAKMKQIEIISPWLILSRSEECNSFNNYQQSK